MNTDKIILKIKPEDKEKFSKTAQELCLTLSGFMKLSAAEKFNKMNLNLGDQK